MTPVSPQRRARQRGRRAERAVLALVAALLVVLVAASSAAAAGPAALVWHGPTDRPRVALTFDDNFNPPNAPRTVQAMIDAGLKATVFVMSQDVYAHPDVARMIAQGGFDIGDHTANHLLLTTVPYAVMLNEIGAGATAFAQVTGRRTVPFFRPPYGKSNDLVLRAAGAKGYTHVFLWDVDVQDWRGISAAQIELRDDVQLAAQLGLMRGLDSGLFDPWSRAQRVHVAVVVSRFLDLARYDGPPPPPPSTTTTTAPPSTTTTTGPTPSTTTTNRISPPTSTTTTTTVSGATTTTRTTVMFPPVTTVPISG